MFFFRFRFVLFQRRHYQLLLSSHDIKKSNKQFAFLTRQSTWRHIKLFVGGGGGGGEGDEAAAAQGVHCSSIW